MKNSLFKLGRSQSTAALLIASALTLGSSAAIAAPGEGCFTANVPWPIVIPDGTTYPAGQIRICLTDYFTPVSGLHEISIGGRSVGILLSRLRNSEGFAHGENPVFYFRRTLEGSYSFEAYSVPTPKRTILFDLGALGPRRPQVVREAAPAGPRVELIARAGP